MLDVLQTLANLSPLGVIGILAYVVYLLVSKNGPVKAISDNHLSGLPQMQESLARMEQTLIEIRDGISYLKGRVNGRS